MTTTALPGLDAVLVLRLINPFTMRVIGGRDLMVDADGVLSFLYGPPSRETRRVEITLTGDDRYAVQVGRIHKYSMRFVVETRHDGVSGADLRATVRELT